MPKTRIYVVRSKDGTGSTRLVRASQRAGAFRHVAESTLTVEVCTTDDLEKLMSPPDPVRVETASEEPAADTQPQTPATNEGLV